jgi:predicted dienelactone hydrolase
MRTVLLALVAVSCASTEAPMSGGPDAGGGGGGDPDAAVDPARPDAGAAEEAADPSKPGPWPVGVRTIELVDIARNRSLPIDVWYPALEDGEPNVYELPPIASIETAARRNATPAPGAPRPLILFSHGYGGVRFQSYFLTERLASHGFVVASPDHPGNTLFDAFTGGDEAAAQSAIDRPLDMLAVLDHLTASSFTPIDPDRVGITGHSFGGWTSFETARRDDRLRVVFPMAPGFRNGARPDMVAELDRPVCIFGGSVDDTTPFDTDQLAPYELAATPKYLIQITGAGHLDFSNLCEIPIAALFVDDGCDPASIAPADVQSRVSTLATAFALRYLAGDEEYDAYLAPAYVNGLGKLEYWSEPE